MISLKVCLTMVRIILATVTFLALTGAYKQPPMPDPIFREDLHPFGYPIKLPYQSVADYTDLAFLSENLVLVSLNVRTFAGGAEPLNTTNPASTLLLFDVSRKMLLKSAQLSIEKFDGSVRATRDGRFVVLQGSEIRLCSEYLDCGTSKSISGDGPMFVSPRGTRFMAGGNGQNRQELLDGDSLQTLNYFSFGQAAMPGDTAVLATRGRQLYLLRDGMPDELLSFSGGNIRLDAQFLSDEVFAIFEGSKTLSVVGLDGKVIYRIPVLPHWSGTDVVPAASGSRFCVHQKAYRV